MLTYAFVQARMRSSRLPGKVLRRLGSRSLLEHVVHRARAVVPRVAVLTSTDPIDDPIAHQCERGSIECWRGPEHDVLERFRAAAAAFGPDTVIRLTADNPLVDRGILCACLTYHAAHPADLTSTRRLRHGQVEQRSAPAGMSVDVLRAGALQDAAFRATTSFQREHVIPVFFEAAEFRVALAELGLPAQALAMSFSVDTETDFTRLERLVAVAGEDADLARLVQAGERR
jgi:spore coat polysaccharide biosynthesis protein SpsF